MLKDPQGVLRANLAINDSQLLHLLGELALQEVIDNFNGSLIDGIPDDNEGLEILLCLNPLKELIQGIASIYAIVVQSEPHEGILEVFKVDPEGFTNARIQAVPEEAQRSLLDLRNDWQGHNGFLITLKEVVYLRIFHELVD